MRLSSLLGLVDAWREEAIFTALDVVAKVMFTVFCEQFAASVWDARALEALVAANDARIVDANARLRAEVDGGDLEAAAAVVVELNLSLIHI